MSYLVLATTSSIQQYIFGSNRLKENIGASYLVNAATDLWAKQAVINAVGGGAHNLAVENGQYRIKADTPTQPFDAEVLYSGGGNFVVVFEAQATAKAFAAYLSRRVLENAAGLHLHISTPQQFSWSTDVLSKILWDARQPLEKYSARNDEGGWHRHVDPAQNGHSGVACASGYYFRQG